MENEKRKHNRIKILGKLVNIFEEDNIISFGYITDIHDDGVGILLNSNKMTDNVINQPFEIKVIEHYSEEPIKLSVTKVWESALDDSKFKRIGCHFNNDNEVKKILDNL